MSHFLESYPYIACLPFAFIGIFFYTLDNWGAFREQVSRLYEAITAEKWSRSGGVIPVAVSVAAGMISIAQNAHSPFRVHVGFVIAYLLFTVALVYAINAVFHSQWAPFKSKKLTLGIVSLWLAAIVITALYHVDRVASIATPPMDRVDVTVQRNDKRPSEAAVAPVPIAPATPLPKRPAARKGGPSQSSQEFTHLESPPCMKDIATCSETVIIDRVFEMADGINQLYEDHLRNLVEANKKWADAKTDVARESVRFALEAKTDFLLNRYRSKYRTTAREYRQQLEERIGPSVHDEDAMKLYDISDTRTMRQDEKLIFLSNVQIFNIPRIANDLRETGKKLQLRAAQRSSQ